MSARFTPKDIHPSIFKEVLAVTGGYMNGSLTDPNSVAAATKHTSVWFAEYWKGIILWICGVIPVLAGTAMLKESVGKPGSIMFFFLSLIIWFGIGYLGLQKNRGVLTWEEVEAVRPALHLNEHQSLYLDCLKHVEESRILDAAQKKSWREALYHALDQAMTLDALSKDMMHSSGGKNQAESMAEIERLDSLVKKSTDDVARQAYGESLQLAQDRMSKWDSIASQAERTEAHLELTKQTFLKTRDTLRSQSLQDQRTVQVDLEPLRANLSRVQTEAYEIQRAIEELKQI
jgi:hypothetical protein